MRVVHINTFETGGAANMMRDLHEGLLHKNISSSILVGYAKGLRKQTLQNTKLSPVIQFGINNIRSILLSEDTKCIDIKTIINHPLVKKSDIIHFHNLHGSYFNLSALTDLSKNKFIIWTLHDMWAITGHCAYSLDCDRWKIGCGKCPYLSLYQKLLFDRSNALWKEKRDIYAQTNMQIVTPSIWLKNNIKNSILELQPSRVIRNGIDTSIYYPITEKRTLRKKLGLPLEKKVFLFVASGGIKNIWKGWKYIEPIIQHYANDNRFQFLVVGEENRRSSKYGMCIPTVSSKEKMADYYRASDMLLFPSIADNCPLVLLEGMSCGLPAVSFNVGGVAEIIDHRSNGYICSSMSTQAMCNGMRYVIEQNNKDLQRMKQKAIEKIQHFYSLKTMVNEYLELYKTFT